MSKTKDTVLGCGCLILVALILFSRGTFLIPIILIFGLVSIIKIIYNFISNNFAHRNDEYNGYRGSENDYNYNDSFRKADSYYDEDHNHKKSDNINIEFVSSIAQLTGYISRGAGRITREHINIVSNFIDLITDDPKIRSLLQDQFDIGKDIHFEPSDVCSRLSKHLRLDFDAQTFILNLLLSLIFADNYASSEEINRLYKVCDLLGIPRNLTDGKISQFQFTSRFRSNSNNGSNSKNENRSSSYESNNRTHSESHSHSSSTSNFEDIRSREDALRILGLSNNATSSEIKRQYLKLMKEYHPDRLKAKGISGKLKEEYENKCKLITSAYNYLK